MDWDRIEGNWKKFKGLAKLQWGRLTDDDLTSIDGRREQLEGLLQERYGYAKDRTRQEVDRWLGNGLSRADSADGQAFNNPLVPFEQAFRQSLRDQPVATVVLVGAVGFIMGALWRA